MIIEAVHTAACTQHKAIVINKRDDIQPTVSIINYNYIVFSSNFLFIPGKKKLKK